MSIEEDLSTIKTDLHRAVEIKEQESLEENQESFYQKWEFWMSAINISTLGLVLYSNLYSMNKVVVPDALASLLNNGPTVTQLKTGTAALLLIVLILAWYLKYRGTLKQIIHPEQVKAALNRFLGNHSTALLLISTLIILIFIII